MAASGPLVGALVGLAVGFGVGLGVGGGVGSGVRGGVGRAVAVARGVGSGVSCGAEVGPPVALGWLGAGVRNGVSLGCAGTSGGPDATAIEGLAPAGDGLATPPGEALGRLGEADPLGGLPLPVAGLPDGAVADGPVDGGVGVAIWAIWLG